MTRLDYLLHRGRISDAAWEAGQAFRHDWRLACQAIGAPCPLRDAVSAIGFERSLLIAETVVYNRSFGGDDRRQANMRATALALEALAQAKHELAISKAARRGHA